MVVEIDSAAIETIASQELAEVNDISIPKWLDDAFIEKHLRTYFNNEQLKIVEIEVKPATAKGENYASYIYRVNVTFAKDPTKLSTVSKSDSNLSNLNIIVKTAVAGEFAFEALSANDIYNKEIEFYNKIGPKIDEKLAKLNIKSELLPKSYGVCRANDAILFEDLKTKDYCISSIVRGFNFDEAKTVLKKAATFHAINAVLQEEEPDIFENFKYGLMSQHTDVFDVFYFTQLDVIMEVLSEWSDGDYYVKKLKRVRKNLMEKGAKAFAPDPNHFNTLIHGDMWVNNLMMKYANVTETDEINPDDLEIENIIFIDFQYSCWTSPTIDLHYFFNNSLQESLRPGRFDELITFYHGHLTTSLEGLEYKQQIPTLEQFKQQYFEKSFYGFVASCLVQPLMINEETADADVEALIVGDERSMKYKRLLYSSPKVRANLRKLIPIYDKMGVFD